ncbi:hypothetical protein BJ508DRAFT_419124 [Ascobolus immersus RN42]|uniref:Uncharacterized protein n=1 Tax=Ascobolus immersus RN42 TaxID=1160509 RepID=A0A3N4HU50_ASCIM|nr:hypothetical protein BJ508DRAFT_419124 [Ascobolus immersus RN42]
MKFSSILTFFTILATSALAVPVPASTAPAPTEWAADTDSKAIEKLFNGVAALKGKNPEVGVRYIFEIRKPLPAGFDATKLNNNELADKKKLKPEVQAEHEKVLLKLKALQKSIGYEHAALVAITLKAGETGPPKNRRGTWVLDSAGSKKLDFKGGPKGLSGKDESQFANQNLPFRTVLLSGTNIYKGKTTKTIAQIEKVQSDLAATKKYSLDAPQYYCGTIASDLASKLALSQ